MCCQTVYIAEQKILIIIIVVVELHTTKRCKWGGERHTQHIIIVQLGSVVTQESNHETGTL